MLVFQILVDQVKLVKLEKDINLDAMVDHGEEEMVII